VFIVAHDMGTSVANELMARDIEGSLDMELVGALLLNGSMVQDAASPTLGQRLLRSAVGPLFSRLSSERFFRQQFGSIFSPGHPLTDEEAEDQWALVCAGGGRTLNHKTIRYMEERFRHAERWHGAIRDWPKPVSLAWGMLDPVATENVLDALVELRPAAPLTRFDDLGHYPQIEDPGRVAAALQGALTA
jgi:pimeloyl-ACP methyl ester carboxylesterase